MEFTCPFCLSQLEVDDECIGQDAVCPYCGKKIKILKLKILKEGCRSPQNVSENVDMTPESHSQDDDSGNKSWNTGTLKEYLSSINKFHIRLKKKLLSYLMKEKGSTPPQDASENADEPHDRHAQEADSGNFYWDLGTFKTFVNYFIQFLVRLKNRLLLMKEKGIAPHADTIEMKENEEGDASSHIREKKDWQYGLLLLVGGCILLWLGWMFVTGCPRLAFWMLAPVVGFIAFCHAGKLNKFAIVLLCCVIAGWGWWAHSHDKYEPEENFKVEPFDENIEISEDGKSIAIKGVKIVEYIGTAKIVKIPPRIDGRKVVVISGFRDNKEITKVTIPKGVMLIGGRDGGFEGCTSLTSVNIPKGVIGIDECTFAGCTNLTSVNIPKGVLGIGRDAFKGCTNLTSVNIPKSVIKIEFKAFEGCTSLTSVNIPNSVTEIGHDAFSGCTKLTRVDIPNSIKEIGWSAFEGCRLFSINIPDGVKIIQASSFKNCTNLTSVNIPKSVIEIEGKAFEGCTSLTSVNIPNSVTAIGRAAFYGCTNLTSVNIPSSVKKIGANAFDGCWKLTNVNLPKGIREIGTDAFPKHVRINEGGSEKKVDKSGTQKADKSGTSKLENRKDTNAELYPIAIHEFLLRVFMEIHNSRIDQEEAEKLAKATQEADIEFGHSAKVNTRNFKKWSDSNAQDIGFTDLTALQKASEEEVGRKFREWEENLTKTIISTGKYTEAEAREKAHEEAKDKYAKYSTYFFNFQAKSGHKAAYQVMCDLRHQTMRAASDLAESFRAQLNRMKEELREGFVEMLEKRYAVGRDEIAMVKINSQIGREYAILIKKVAMADQKYQISHAKQDYQNFQAALRERAMFEKKNIDRLFEEVKKQTGSQPQTHKQPRSQKDDKFPALKPRLDLPALKPRLDLPAPKLRLDLFNDTKFKHGDYYDKKFEEINK